MILLIALIWIVALILAIPTFGVSLVVALIIATYINKQENLATAQVVLSAVAILKIDVLNKYSRLRMQEGLSPTRKTDADIFDGVMKICDLIESVLKESGRFHDDKDNIIQLAVRLVSYSEDFNRETCTEIAKEQLAYVSNVGVIAALRRPYMPSKALSAIDDDLPF